VPRRDRRGPRNPGVVRHFAAFEGAPVYGAGAEDVAAASWLFYALFCCLVAVGLIVAALFRFWPHRLLPAAAVAFSLAATLCAAAASAAEGAYVLGLVCVLLALLTPWWRLGAGPAVVVVVVLGAVSVPLLRL
jgi:hypothetical protein